MRPTSPVPPRRVQRPVQRPVLLAALAVTTAGSLLLTPHTATADRKPVTREGVESERSALDGRAAQTPAGAATRALTAPVTDLTGSARGYPREQTLSPTRRTRATSPSSWA